MNGNRDSNKGIDIDTIVRISPTKKRFCVPIELRNDLEALIIDSLVNMGRKRFFFINY